MFRSDICIAGAGIIGLSLALELQARGLRVIVLDAGEPMREASIAAAGMLAADDPHNPAELKAMAQLSASLYPAFLDRLASLGGDPVPFQTTRTLQEIPLATPKAERTLPDALLAGAIQNEDALHHGFQLLQERSLDPRQLARSIVSAVTGTAIEVHGGVRVSSTTVVRGVVAVNCSGQYFEAEHFVDCTGAWTHDPAYSVVPIKGQMLAVALPAGLPIAVTSRTQHIYIVPRITGPHAGRAIIGATVEDIGFNRTVDPLRVEELHRQAAELIPRLATSQVLEAWSGLRPATADRLPIVGAHPTRPRHWIATGHYRNGILLAPATALVLAEAILGERLSADLDSFAAHRSSLKTS